MEGGGSSSGRTIHGAAIDMGSGDDIERLHLYVSRPQGKFWLLDLARPNAPVRTLAPSLLPPPIEGSPAPSLGGRLFVFPDTIGGGVDGLRFLLSWTPLGALYVVAVGGGEEAGAEEEDGTGPRAACLWTRGLHSLAVRVYLCICLYQDFHGSK